MYAAAEKNLPIVVPGWEDSTMGNIFASYVIKGELKASTMKSGIEYMTFLADWYKKQPKRYWFFQIGGGIAGDFLSVLFQCFIKIWKCMTFLSGVISVKYQILQQVMVLILEQFQMKKSLGVN
jgi:hypothetical protein